MKKCPISRANIVHFNTLTLYQNVSHKMVGMRGLEPLRREAQDSKSCVSANFTTSPSSLNNNDFLFISKYYFAFIKYLILTLLTSFGA